MSLVHFLYPLHVVVMFFFFKQKTAYEMRISDWSSDVCSSDLVAVGTAAATARGAAEHRGVSRRLARTAGRRQSTACTTGDRKSVVSGKSVSVSVDFGGRRILKTKKRI